MQKHKKQATGRQIVSEILRNMHEGFEPLPYSIIVPGLYRVYLAPQDHSRLATILARIGQQAATALDEELKRLNHPALVDRLARGNRVRYERATNTWDIQFYEDAHAELSPGEVAVSSEIALPESRGLGGAMTMKRTTTIYAEDPQKPYGIPQDRPARAYAEIGISGPMDSGVYHMTKDEIVIGRGGDRRVDLVVTHPSVSRIHLRIRRERTLGKFFVRSFGDYGSTLNGIPIPRSKPDAEGGAGSEMLLPPRATIDLADQSVVLEFQASTPG
jgi:hypothetical protein